jgi:hypothetical protein
MNITPKSVFTGKGSNGEKVTFFEWDYSTWAGFEVANNIFILLVALLLSAITSPLLLILCIANFNGRHKPLYIIGWLVSAYFIYDCNHGWLTMQAINFLFGESVVTFLLALNVASLILFSIFLLVGGMLYNFIEDLTPTIEGRWGVFIIFLSIVIIPSVVVIESSKDKGWAMHNIKFESKSDKNERLEEERVRDLGDFESQEARDKYFNDLERRCGDKN